MKTVLTNAFPHLLYPLQILLFHIFFYFTFLYAIDKKKNPSFKAISHTHRHTLCIFPFIITNIITFHIKFCCFFFFEFLYTNQLKCLHQSQILHSFVNEKKSLQQTPATNFILFILAKQSTIYYYYFFRKVYEAYSKYFLIIKFNEKKQILFIFIFFFVFPISISFCKARVMP